MTSLCTRSSVARSLGAALAVAALAPAALSQKPVPMADPPPTVVGAGMRLDVLPNLDESYESTDGRVWGEVIYVKDASFLKVHFVDLNLRPGDVLVLRSRSGKIVEQIKGRGPKDHGTFWSLSAFGDELYLEFFFEKPYERLPFRIDEVLVGDPGLFSQATDDGPESICSPSDFEDVVCYDGDAGKWANVLGSVGVMNVGSNPTTGLWCSGSNVSPSNYLLTNAHCIGSQSGCDSSEFVFKYYRTACNVGAPTNGDWESFRCDELVALSPLGDCDPSLSALDYGLFTVIGDPAATYGYVTPDPTPLTDGEDIYIIQHPAGRPHEIAHGGGVNVDVDGTTLRYYDTLDTEGGSSGSPIFRESDDKLVGLHHCGGCSTSGVGNRGMLMSDIYPEIQSFLCTTGVELLATDASGLTQVAGNGNSILEPGETWQFTPSVRNVACSEMALNVQATIQVNASTSANVVLLDSTATFGNVAAGATAQSQTPIQFRLKRSTPCGSTVSFDMVGIQAMGVGPFNDALAIVGGSIGDAPVQTVYNEDFTGGQGAWAIVDGGAGTGPAQTWTTANPGGRSLSLSAPFFIADSDEHGSSFALDEELIGPAVDCSGYETVTLQFSHDFNWYSGGMDEQADVDIRSSATGGAWVNVANYSGGDTSGTVMIDVTAQAAGAADVQVRFHYYDALFEWWWAVDDVFLLGGNYQCEVFGGGASSAPQRIPF